MKLSIPDIAVSSQEVEFSSSQDNPVSSEITLDASGLIGQTGEFCSKRKASITGH